MAPAQLMERLSTLEQENAELRAQLEWFKRNLFGTGKSEKLDALQLRLGIDIQESKAEAPKPQTITYQRNKPAPREMPAERFKDLPVHETIEIIPDEVRKNPELYQRIGEETTFEVDITPPRLFKRLIVRPKHKYLLDPSRPPVLAPAPPRAVEGGYASAGLLAYIALSKYLYHLPLYRQEKMSRHWGAHISRKTMADWIEVVSDWFKPIYGRMRQNLLEGGYLQADETPVKFMDPDDKKGKTTQGNLWVFGKPRSDVVFDWRLTRKHSEVTSLLKGFKGILQSDGYAAYETVAGSNEKIIRVACWAHARRKFTEAQRESPIAVGLVLNLVGRFYHWEKQWDRAGYTGASLRAALRISHFSQSLSLLKKVVLHLKRKARPKSNLGKACNYLLGQWSPLISHCLFGETRIDNNLIENAIRPSAVGKKNFLFIGSPTAGQRSAIIYSIIVSCERHGIDPYTYMRDVLQRLPTMSNQDNLDALLPVNWKPVQ